MYRLMKEGEGQIDKTGSGEIMMKVRKGKLLEGKVYMLKKEERKEGRVKNRRK